jgi:hypothetical protein
VGHRHHRAPHPGGQALLRGRARRALPSSRGLVHRRHPDRGPGHQRAQHGHRQPQPRPSRRDRDPLRPRRAIHILGVHPPGPGVRAGPIHGLDRRLLRQRRRRILLGPGPDRAPQPPPLENPHRARQRPVRVPRDLPQPAPPTQLPWTCSHPSNTRSSPPPRPREPSNPTPPDPGHIRRPPARDGVWAAACARKCTIGGRAGCRTCRRRGGR